MAHLQGQERVRYVKRMFARISRRYDLLNTIMTAGRHYAWRRIATDMAVSNLRGPVLDIATGTGDFAIELARRPSISHVVGLDNTPEMLSLAMRKAQQKRLSKQLTLVVGDAHALPFLNDHFICATVGFGIRNFIDASEALREMVRVVKPGGRVVTLEIVRIEGGGPWSRLFPACFRYVTPWIGALLAADREAYTYLPESVQSFFSPGELASVMREAGLRDVIVHKLALGAVAVHVGTKG